MKPISRIIFTTLLITGCTSLPPPVPSVIFPKKTRTGLPIVHTTTCTKAWWKRMHDPQLNQLIEMALINNNQIKSAEASILQAKAKLKQARFAWMPSLNVKGNGFLGGGWETNAAPQGALSQSQVLSKMGSLHFRGYYSGFVPNYSLNILENIHNNKLAFASLNLQYAAAQATRLSVISQVAGSYFMLLGQRQQLQEQSQYIVDLKKSRQLEWVRYKQGASDLSTVIAIDQKIANNEASLPNIEDSISQIENALQILLNRNPGFLQTHKNINALSTRGLIPKNLPSTVLKNRPDIIIAKENLKISAANVGLAYANFFPMISLTGILGTASVELSHLLELSTQLWLAQAAASIPILNGTLYQQIKASKAGYSSATYNYIQTLRTAFADVDNSLTHQQKINKIYLYRLQALHDAKISHKLALVKYQSGAKDYRDVAQALINVDEAEMELNQAKMQQLDSIVEVYQALGGEW